MKNLWMGVGFPALFSVSGGKYSNDLGCLPPANTDIPGISKWYGTCYVSLEEKNEK
jgi:hypothetical protein